MAATPSWKGFLKLNLVAVPVKAYTATAGGGGRIQLNQLHAECNGFAGDGARSRAGGTVRSHGHGGSRDEE
jgi:hypothetical protein